MKKYVAIIVAVTLMLLFTDVFADPGRNSTPKLIECYLQALNHSNQGVVESAIINVMKLKLNRPDADYRKIIKCLDKMVKENPNKIVRIKAYIAASYLKYPERFNWINTTSYEETDRLFNLLTEKLNDYNK